MRKTLAYATLFSTALLGSGAFAQPAVAADNQPVPMKQDQAQPAKGADANSQLSSGINFVTLQEKTQWRAPKLIEVDVYGADNKKIGKIDDILMGHDGKAQAVVIGVGGFLGIGKKDVAVPFSAIEWKTEPRKVPATDLQPTNSVASTTTGQTAGPPPMKELTRPPLKPARVIPIGRSSMRPRRNSREPLTFTMRQILSSSPRRCPQAAGRREKTTP